MEYENLKLQNQLCFPIYLCSKEMIRSYTKILNFLNLTYTQYIVMMYLWEYKKTNVKELGNTLLLDSSTLTPVLKKLEHKRYLVRKRSDLDERNLEISLTESGEKLKEKASKIPDKMKKCIGLNREESEQMAFLAYKILKHIMEEKNENKRD